MIKWTIIKEEKPEDSNASIFIRKEEDKEDNYLNYCVAISKGNEVEDEADFDNLQDAENNFNKRLNKFLEEYQGWMY